MRYMYPADFAIIFITEKQKKTFLEIITRGPLTPARDTPAPVCDAGVK